MRPRKPLPLSAVELELRCTGLEAFADAPDAAASTIRAVGDWNELRATPEGGETRRIAAGVTLPGLLSLWDHVAAERDGAPVVGMEAVPILIDAERVSLGFRPPLVGDLTTALVAVEGLLEEFFATLRTHGLDSRELARRAATIRGTGPGEIMALHDRLEDGSAP
ncbi:MAG: hypothetical protein ABEJ35_05755 [Halobacteriaceae archaeon]